MAVPRLLLLPGLGADDALFEPQRRAFPDLEVIPWIQPRPRESLEDFGRRMSETVRLDGVVLGGVSFGGMVASIMARHGRPRALVLIASSPTGRAVGGFRRPVAHVVRSLPSVLRPPRPVWPVLAWAFGASDPKHKEALYRFVARAPMPFVQWGLSALLCWSPPSAPGTPLFHIHGSADHLIPLHRVKPTEVVDGGGHLINVTHAEHVNAFVRRAIASPVSHGADAADLTSRA